MPWMLKRSVASVMSLVRFDLDMGKSPRLNDQDDNDSRRS